MTISFPGAARVREVRMKKMKRRLSAMLIMLLMVGAMAIPAQAKTVQVQGGPRIEKATNLVYGNNKYYVGRVTDVKKDLWYRFQTRSTDNFYTISAKNLSVDGYVDIALTDRYEDTVYSGYMWTNSENVKNIKLKKSTYYYIHIHNESSNSGNVKISIKTRKDAIGDTKKAPRALAIGKGTSSSIDGDGDTDFIRIKPASTGYYRISVKNCSMDGYLDAYVLDSYDEQLYYAYMWKDNLKTTKIKLVKGRYYYIKLYGTTVGTYKVSVRR